MTPRDLAKKRTVREEKNSMELDMEFYVNQIKKHEELRLSTNQRQAFWEAYRKKQQGLDEETGFDMSRFSNEIK